MPQAQSKLELGKHAHERWFAFRGGGFRVSSARWQSGRVCWHHECKAYKVKAFSILRQGCYGKQLGRSGTPFVIEQVVILMDGRLRILRSCDTFVDQWLVLGSAENDSGMQKAKL